MSGLCTFSTHRGTRQVTLFNCYPALWGGIVVADTPQILQESMAIYRGNTAAACLLLLPLACQVSLKVTFGL